MFFEQIPALPGDYGSRLGARIDTVVVHTTQGPTVESALDWWDRADVVASAHYLIDLEDDVRLVQRVDEALAAYHPGNRAVANRSIGIEVVGDCRRPELWTDLVLDQLVELTADVCRRHGIPVLRQPGPGICGHCDVPDPYHPKLRGGASHHVDPGPFFPWERFLEAVRLEVANPRRIEQRYPPSQPPDLS